MIKLDKKYERINELFEIILEYSEKKNDEFLNKNIENLLDKFDKLYIEMYIELEEKSDYIEQLNEHIDALKYDYKAF